MSKTTKPKHFEQSMDWETSQAVTIKKSEKRAWLVAGGFAVIALAEGLGLTALIPLHRIEPYVITQNEVTGVVEAAKSLKDSKTTWNEVTKKADLRKYVRARESYSRALAGDYYKRAWLMSSPNEADRYQQFYNPKLNKSGTSPVTIYGDGGTVAIKIKSVSFINDKAASVNYIKIVKVDQLATTRADESEWIATVTYKYGIPPAGEDDRELNPSGIQISEYRNDPVNPNANEAK